MMKKILFTLLLVLPVWVFAQVETASAKNWAFKTDLLNPIFNSVSLEAERRFGENWTMGLRLGVTGGKARYEEFEGNLFGYYVKAGPKFYLSSEKSERLAGFAIHPQLMFSYWRDWNANLFGNKGARWENSVGILVQGSYAISLGKSIRFEPMVGIGYAPTFYSENWPGDVPSDPSLTEYRWLKEDWYYVEQPTRTHLPLPLDIALSVGIQFGVTF